MNKDTINTIGRWCLLLILVGTAIYFVATGKDSHAAGFGSAAVLFWAIEFS